MAKRSTETTKSNHLITGLLALIGIALGVFVYAMVGTKDATTDSPLTTAEPEAKSEKPSLVAGQRSMSGEFCPAPSGLGTAGDGFDFPKNAAESVRINDRTAPAEPPEGMVWIPGGVYWRGNRNGTHPDARPWHLVEVDGFFMDATPVTNAQYAEFVKATGYVTIAEQKPSAQEFTGAPPENLVPGAVVFTATSEPVPLNNHFQWWQYVPGACWRHPEGPKSNLEGREKFPVVQIAFEDAVAYCKWAGKRLPTEAEFEFAARGGIDRALYPWGNELRPQGKWMANIWQGVFPVEDLCDDGHRGAAPVKSFPPNGFGLYDMSGNVWQWCADWYRYDYYRTLAEQSQPARNPQGPSRSYDPVEPTVKKRVMRGGSFLCTDQYCTAYEAGSRGKGAIDTGTNHLGFRCVK